MSSTGEDPPIDPTSEAAPGMLDDLRADLDGEPEAAPAPAQGRGTPASDAAARAREFVAEARARQVDRPIETSEDGQRTGRRSRSGMVIVVAVLVAAQILAVGVYASLRALDDDTEIAASAEDESIPEVTVAVPAVGQPVIVGPTAEPTPTVLPTATPVPATPVWVPEEGGPRQAPFTYIVTPRQTEPTFFDQPDGEPIDPVVDGQPLAHPWPSGAALRLRVVSGDPASEWAQVTLPDADASLVWIRSADYGWSASYRLVQVDVTANRVRVFEGNTVVFEAIVATGARETPTLRLQTWIVQNPFGDEVGEQPRLILAAAQGQPTTAIEIADDESILDTYATDGVVLIAEGEARTLARAVPTGAKVEIIGFPAPPTPTPVATPTPRPTSVAGSGGGGGGGGRCPRGAQGAPPNCYRVVAREQIPGSCPRSEVAINNQCMIFGGNPERFDDAIRCADAAPVEIDGRCYTPNGPIPTVDGPCPAGSTDVGGECREPV